MSSRKALRLIPLVLQPSQGSGNLLGLQSLGLVCSRRWLGGGQAGRLFASQAGEDSSLPIAGDKQLDCAKSILQQAKVLKLRQDLEDEAERSLHIPYHQLLAMARESGAAHNDGEAEEVSTALHRAGVVLRHNDVVFLRPREIADMVMQILPGGREDATKKLESIEAELKSLEETHQKVEKQAHRTTHRFLFFGYIILFTQLVAFIRLTFWELSWDVMEPIAYIISLFYTLVGYTYFLATKGRVFDLEPFREFWHTHFMQKKAAEIKFDEERYRYLRQLKERYQRHLAHAALRR